MSLSQAELEELKALAREAFALMERAGAGKSAEELLAMDAAAWAAQSPELALCALKIEAWCSNGNQSPPLARQFARKAMGCVSKGMGEKEQAAFKGFGRLLAMARQGDLQALACSAEAELLDGCVGSGKRESPAPGL